MSVKMIVAFALIAVAQAASLPQASLVNRRAEQQPIRMSLKSVKVVNGKELATEEVAEGKSITVEFELARRPECADKDRCFVRVLLENNRPDEVALSACYIEWDATEPEFCCANCDGKGIKKMCPFWMKKKQVEITTVEDFVDDGEKDILIKTMPAVSTSEFFKHIDIPDIKIRTPDKGTAECSSTTDPNYKQFDGGRFTVNTAGTFSLWKAPQRDWEVQGRVDSRGMNCGLALRDGCDRIVFDRCSGGALSMRKFMDPTGDATLQPKISRDGDKTWIVTSRRSGAQVKVIHRVSITRVGWTSCGWSGCRRSPINSVKEFLDFYLKTPGSDFGFMDSVTTDKTMPRITGVCGTWTKDRSDDLARVGSASGKLTAVTYANQFKVAGSTLFDANPSVCKTTTPPVKIEPKECSVVPRRIQKPVIGIFDIEDITELLKNSLEGEAEDEEDEASKYTFNLNTIKEPTRTDEFEREAEAFCKDVLLNSDVARRCLKMKVEGEQVDLDQWVRSCYQDIWWQDSGVAGDSTRHTLAASTHDSMENYCIDLRSRSDEFERGCSAGEDCQVTGTGAGAICVGDCTIKPVNDFKEMLAVRCPNSCGKNFRRDGAGGKCMQNSKGKNVCICHSPDHWGGEDCTTEIGGVKPYISKLVPHTCDVSKNQACANEVVVHADTAEGTLFAKGDGVKCMVDGKEVNATFLDQTRIRCHLPEYNHAIGKPVHHRKVTVALNGKSFAQPLHFCHHDSSCTECVSAKGLTNVKKDTCHIHDMCHIKGSKGESLTKYHKCRVCDPEHSQSAWKYHYNHDDCAPQLKKNIAYEVNEMHPLQRAINLNNPVTTDMNYNTRDDKENKPTFTLMEDSQFFSLEKDTGIIRLIDSLDFEKAATHKLKVRASQGGLHSEGEVTISVFNADEGCSFAQSEYTATVVENAPLGALQGVNVSVSCPGGDATTYSLEVRGSGSAKAPFAINPTTGAVTTTKPLDFEERKKWPLRILAKSATGSRAAAYLTVTVTDVNEAPTFINLDTASLKENQPKGAKVASIEVNDPDAKDTFTLGLSDDTEGWFAIKNNNELVLAKDGMDYETMASKTIKFSITAMDSKGLKLNMEQSIRVEDANDAPTKIHVDLAKQEHGAKEMAALTSIPETAEVGTVLAHLRVDDADAGQSHGFRVLGDSPFAIADGNSLVLAKALDFEASDKVSVQLVAFDDSESNPLTSKKQEFKFAVVDGADVPRDFKLVGGQIVPEMSAAGTVVGTVEAVDQDLTDDFIIKILDGSSAFAVGATACSQVLGRGTVCSAQVTVSGNQAIDFEANRVSLNEAQLTVKVSAKSLSGESDCGNACPVVMVSNAPDSPSGAKLSAEGISDVTVEQDGSVTIQESADMLGALAAIDQDDSCPLTIKGCADVSAAGAYTFAMAPHDHFELAGACANAQPTDARVAGASCSLRVKGAATLAAGDNHEVTITVTDQDGLSTDHVQKVKVIEAKVAIVIEAADGMLLTKNAEGKYEFAEKVAPEGWLPASRIKVAGWTSEAAVPKPTVVSGPFRLGAYSRRSRRGMTTQWTLEVDTSKLNVDVNTELSLVLSVAAVGDFAGLEQTLTFAVTQFVAAGPATQITVAGAKPRSAKKDDATASAFATLSAFAPAGTEVAALKFSDEAVATTFAILSEFPKLELFAVVDSKLVTLKKPSGDSVDLVIQALQGGVVVNTFAIVVDIDYCAGNTVCGNGGTCQECHSGPGGEESCAAEKMFMCVCADAFMGETCAARKDVANLAANTGSDSGSDSDSGMIAGIIVGVVALLIIIAVVVVVAMMRSNAQNMESQKQSVYADVAKRDADAQAMYDAANTDEGSLPARPDESYEAISNTVMDMSMTVSNPMYKAGESDNYAGYSNDAPALPSKGAQPVSNPNYNMDSSI